MNEKEQIFKLIGEIIWLSQLIESDLKKLILVNSHDRINSDADLVSEGEKYSKGTLGWLIKLFMEKNVIFKLEERDETILNDCLAARNLVTHNLFIPEPPDIQSSEGRKSVISELLNNYDKIKIGHDLVSGMFENLACSLGVDIEKIKSEELEKFEKDK